MGRGKDMNRLWFGVFLFFILISLLSYEEEYCPGLSARYEPTPHEVVRVMLAMARVNENDIVYDLGCGDGRIVIAAAKMGAKGIGIDMDPLRIAESKENAQKGNVSGRVNFIQQDLFEATISDASVITLYLLPWVNLALRPKIFKEVLPGTRVVSHSHTMGEWEPDIFTVVNTGDPSDYNDHTVLLWVVPANVSGSWKWTLPIEDATKCEMRIQQKFQRVNGVLAIGDMNYLIQDMMLTGNRIKFSVEFTENGKFVQLFFEGQVKEHTINGLVISGKGLSNKKYEWHATRDPSTVRPFDE